MNGSQFLFYTMEEETHHDLVFIRLLEPCLVLKNKYFKFFKRSLRKGTSPYHFQISLLSSIVIPTRLIL